MFLAALFMRGELAKGKNDPNIHQPMNNYVCSLNGILFSHIK